jgi:hypothetical protein
MKVKVFSPVFCLGLLVGSCAQTVLAQQFDFETTIHQPVVNQPIHEYPDIAFQSGDRILLDAGGCVQTGGIGKTWKRYVDPSGEAADRLYHGLVFIPGVTPGLVRVGGVINRPLDVPTGMGAWPPLHLILGYEDSDGAYADNGYWGHDDGTEDQCKDVGPAWVTIRVKHGVNALRGTANMTGPKDFDLKWDLSDPNGYPFNPRWQYTLDNQAVIVDPVPHCNAFAWTQQGVDPGPSCVSLKLGVDTLGYWKDWLPGLCENDALIRGHINWGEVTYEGPIRFVVFDKPELYGTLSPPFVHVGEGDDDVNLALFPLHIAKAPLVPANHNGQFTNPNDLPADVGAIILEFDSDETIDNFHKSAWWQSFIANPHIIEDKNNGEVVGKEAVVTGILGLDAPHPHSKDAFSTEIHPVHAIAIRSKEDVDPNTGTVVEEWGYFVRNWGNEGECSQERLHPAPFPSGDFSFRLPWRTGMEVTDFYRGEWTSSGLPNSFFPSQAIIKDVNGVPTAVRVDFDGFPDPQQKPWVAGSFSIKWKSAPPPPPVLSFGLSVTPNSVSIAANDSQSVHLSTTMLNDANPIGLSYSVPAGVVVGQFAPTSVTPGQSVDIGFAVPLGTPPGPKGPITITGSKGSETRSVTVGVTTTACGPQSCGDAQCGSVNDNCGHTLLCGSCGGGLVCGGGQCVPSRCARSHPCPRGSHWDDANCACEAD